MSQNRQNRMFTSRMMGKTSPMRDTKGWYSGDTQVLRQQIHNMRIVPRFAPRKIPVRKRFKPPIPLLFLLTEVEKPFLLFFGESAISTAPYLVQNAVQFCFFLFLLLPVCHVLLILAAVLYGDMRFLLC